MSWSGPARLGSVSDSRSTDNLAVRVRRRYARSFPISSLRCGLTPPSREQRSCSRVDPNRALLDLAQSASKKENVPRYRLFVYRLRSHAGGFKRLRAVEEIVLADD